MYMDSDVMFICIMCPLLWVGFYGREVEIEADLSTLMFIIDAVISLENLCRK